jgi:ATP-binding cassette subfamily C protein CydC
MERVYRSNQDLIRLQVKQTLVDTVRETLHILLTDGCAWVLLLLAIPLVRSGQIAGVYLAGIVLATLGCFEAVGPLASAAQRWGGCLEAACRLTEIVDIQPAVRDPATTDSVPLHFSLEVSNLSFCYGEDGPLVLNNISFAVPQGRCVAIVGPSGAGKSTLASLLLRFWEYQQGSLSLGGHPVNTLRQEDVRRWIGVVEQRTHLFNTTVRENLLLARPDASQEEIEKAARQALIHDIIQALPQGYATRIGEQGFRLSGGERQRLALARTMLKDAPVLLLDEPTAHLDALTEQKILLSLRTFMQGRTTLLITHRLIGLEMADEILVMEHGQIKERGKHDELLQAEGLYWKHWTLQNQLLCPGSGLPG